jgi:hypothetical protein
MFVLAMTFRRDLNIVQVFRLKRISKDLLRGRRATRFHPASFKRSRSSKACDRLHSSVPFEEPVIQAVA